MSHPLQVEWCLFAKNIFPNYFINKDVLDVGSQDINGNNKVFFENCNYIGLDVGHGLNVDVVCPIHLYNPEKYFDTIISTEMLEHDSNYEKSLIRMYELLKPEGLLVLTAAGHNRPEHGTINFDAWTSPHTTNYYGNIYIKTFTNVFELEKCFKKVIIDYDYSNNDIRFIGLKR